MKWRDETNEAPGPVLIRMNRVSVRDNIMKYKDNLKKSEDRRDIYINADEPVELHRAKGILRKTACNARNYGVQVEMRHNCIMA